MQNWPRLSLAALLAIFAVTVTAWSAETPNAPLGSPDFRPTLQRSFGWRGDGSGRFPGAAPVTEWSATKNVRWATVVGRSYSCPIVTDKFVFVTSEPDLLICLDRAGGKVLWKVEIKPADLPDENSRKAAEKYEAPKDGSGLTAATPLTDGKSIYAVLANGIICAVDLDGKRKWTACIIADPTTGYGRSSSPIFVAGKLIVHMSNLYAFDHAAGRQLWVSTEAKSSYGTPVNLRIGDIDLIVTPNGDVVRAADGKSVASEIGRASHSSPIQCGEGIVCFGNSEVLALQLNAASKEEAVWSGMVGGDVFGSPLLHDNTLFITTGAGELFAFNASGRGEQEPLINGRKLFENENSGGPTAYASLTLAGKYLFLNSNKGEVVVLEAKREARLVGRNKLPAGSGSSPVFSGKDMFLRDGDKLLCIGE
jgi:outer membrane protein assembly factor BamB